MGRIVVMNHVSLDGVIQAPGRADEDTRGGFTHGGWAISDDAGGEAMGARIAAGGGLSGWLLGRRTYEDVLDHWTQVSDSPFGAALVATPKYVASSTLAEPPPWPNTTVLRGDPAGAVARLKPEVDGVLAIMGSSQLIGTLLAHDLVDELLLMIHPLLLGSGIRLFPDDSTLVRYRCREANLSEAGLLITSYVRPDAD